jgi:hypothetical protein
MSPRASLAAASVAVLVSNLGVGVSVGLYYTELYYGRHGALLPTPVCISAPLIYYVARPSSLTAEAQAALWMALFPVCALTWVCLLLLATGRTRTVASVARLLWGLALASLPIVGALPWMVWVCGAAPDGWSWRRLVDVSLRRAFVESSPAMTLVFVACAALAMLLEGAAARRFLGGRWVFRAAACVGAQVVVSVVGGLVLASVLGGLGL